MIESQYCADNVFQGNIGTKYRHYFLIPAVLITIGLSCLEKRRNVKPNLLKGRPAFVRPFSFIDEPRNRVGLLLAFGSVTGNIISVTLKTVVDAEFPIWAKIFLVYLFCLEVSIIVYPLFACMTTRHKLVGSITGLLYAIGWFAFELFSTVQILRCYAAYTKPEIGVNIGAHLMMQELPITLCNFLLIPKFCLKLYNCWKKGIYKTKKRISICQPTHIEYVKHLLQKHRSELTTQSASLTLKQKIHIKIMKPVPGFRFPIPILMSTFMSSIMLYMVSLNCAMTIELFGKGTPQIEEHIDLITASTIIATIVTIVCGLRNIYLFLLNYRRDMLLLYKGDRSFVPSNVQTPSPNVYMAQGMRFIGTSVVGMLWGTVFVFLLIFVPLVCTMLAFRILNALDKLGDIWLQFQWLIYPVCMIVIFKLQVFLIGKFFIQPKIKHDDNYKPLAVDNRNLYDVFSFFMIFLNASIGIVTFAKRIMIGAFLGIFLLPRMDRSLLMRRYENMDKCYTNYIGMIMVDEAHNHPVLRVFAWVLKSESENRRDKKPLQSAVDNPEYGNVVFSNGLQATKRNTIQRRRWLLAYTLIRNPSLVTQRVRFVKPSDQDSSLDPNQIDYAEKAVELREEVNTWKFSFRCFNNYKCTIPPNIIINGMALLVLVCVLILYSGIPILLSEFFKQVSVGI